MRARTSKRVTGALCLWLLGWLASSVYAETFYVSTDGSDFLGTGSAGSPWRTLTHAVDQADDGDLVLVRPGTYDGRQSLRAQFDTPVTIRSEVPYAARLRHNAGAALIVFTGRNLVIEGFDIAHAVTNTGGLVVQIQDLQGDFNGSNNGSDAVVSDIVLRNNIIHSSTNNDLLKINNGAERIRVEGNLFFNQQGSDEHIDINSVIDVEVVDNVFLNTADRPDTSSYVVIKDSNGTSDTVLGARDIRIRRNVFLNWHGSSGQGFLRVGEDGTPNFEARDVLIENNLMLGNSSALMRAPLTVQGSRDVTFRNNTVHCDLPSRSYAGRLIAGPNNLRNENLRFFNNVYADPTGTLGSEAFSGVDLFDAPMDQTSSAELNRNLYWNGPRPVPVDSGQFLDLGDDANAMVADPRLPSLQGLVPPVWDGSGFADGSQSVREAFLRLVERYGVPATGSPVVDAADVSSSASEDMLGRPRGARPDLGALERVAEAGPVFQDGFEGSPVP